MKKKLALGCLVTSIGVPLVLFLVGFLLPAGYEVERSIVIDAPSTEIHPLLEDLRRWSEWSVWHERDPTMTVRYSGPERGVDSSMAWDSETEESGTLTITAADPAKGVWADLSIEDTFESKVAILYEPSGPDGSSTKLTWLNRGEMPGNPLFRYFVLVMDAAMGPDFEGNLANIKALVEAN